MYFYAPGPLQFCHIWPSNIEEQNTWNNDNMEDDTEGGEGDLVLWSYGDNGVAA